MIDSTIRLARSGFRSTFIRRGLLLGSAALLISSGNVDAPKPANSSDAITATFHEARLRKLHLVRPDLISYPIASDALC